MTLRGKRILVTRGGDQAVEFAGRIREKGGIPVLFPTVRLVPASDSVPLDRALGNLSSYDGILFTSANAARFFGERAEANGVRGVPGTVRLASVGPGTSRELRRMGFQVHLEAGVHTAEGLLEALGRDGISGKRFLFPRAKEGREVLPDGIARLGGAVDVVVAYENGLAGGADETAREIVASPPDVCTFASPSAFRNFFLLLGERNAAAVLARSRIAVIGEVTARAVEERDFRVDIIPETYTLMGLIEAIEARLS